MADWRANRAGSTKIVSKQRTKREVLSGPLFLYSTSASVLRLDLIKGGIGEVDISGIHFLFAQPQAFANTINMKWIKKEPPTLFFNGILTNSQLFCAFIKVPLQPYDLYWGYAAIFLRIHSLSSAIHQLSSKIWYSIIVAWR